MIAIALIAAFFAFTTGYGIGWIDGLRKGCEVQKKSAEEPRNV